MRGFRKINDGVYDSLDGRFRLDEQPRWLLIDLENEELDDNDRETNPSYRAWTLREVLALVEQLRAESL